MGIIPSLIEITALPQGDPPEEIRRGWIGCVLPCEGTCGHIPVYVWGVLGKSLGKKIIGFSVPTGIALQVLAVHAPQSAEWFEAHGYPDDRLSFHFQSTEARVVCYLPDDAPGKYVVYDDIETGSMRPMG